MVGPSTSQYDAAGAHINSPIFRWGPFGLFHLGGGDVDQDRGPEPFKCHPECLKWSYWRRLTLEIKQEIAGLRTGQLAEMVVAVEEAEAAWCLESSFAEWRDQPIPRSQIGKQKATELWLRGWSENLIDSTLGFPHGSTAMVLGESRLHAQARDVVAAHLEGNPPSRISRDYKVARKTIDGILESIGEVGHQVRPRAASAVTNHAVITLYDDLRRRGAKNIYAEIARRTGISEQQVRARLQYARKKGRITEPPLPRSNLKRRGLRAAE